MDLNYIIYLNHIKRLLNNSKFLKKKYQLLLLRKMLSLQSLELELFQK